MAHEGPDLFATEVPSEHQKYVDRLRKFLNDTPQANELLEEEESTDLELYHAILDTYDQINNEFEPTTLHYEKLEDIPSWNVLKMGGVLNVLISKGILSARNQLSYQDSGGVSINMDDEYGRYVNFYNLLTNKYTRQAMAMKRGTNMNGCYGGVHSPYNDLNA